MLATEMYVHFPGRVCVHAWRQIERKEGTD